MISKKMQKSIEDGISIRDIFEEGKKLIEQHGKENVYDFSIGNPSAQTPAIVNESMIEILKNEPGLSLHGYPSNVGYPEVRECVAKHLNETYSMDYKLEDIIMTSGAASAIAVISKALLDMDDEVVTFAPYFWEYSNYVGTYYAKLIPALCNQETLQPDPETFRATFSEKTKMVIINSPNNPTGAVYTEESIKMVCDIMKEKEQEYGHPIYLVSDEPYRLLAYGDVEVPWIPKYYKNTLVVYSYSKALSIPGERIGYIAMTPGIEDAGSLIAGFTLGLRFLGYVNAPTLQQKMLLKCVDQSVDKSLYEKNRDLLYNSLTEIGYECIKPDGAFYLFVRSLEEDDVAFCKKAKEEMILVAPGSAFYGPGFVRVSYCVGHEVVQKSIPAFKKLFDKYNQ